MKYKLIVLVSIDLFISSLIIIFVIEDKYIYDFDLNKYKIYYWIYFMIEIQNIFYKIFYQNYFDKK